MRFTADEIRAAAARLGPTARFAVDRVIALLEHMARPRPPRESER